jgi:hypothetical protein
VTTATIATRLQAALLAGLLGLSGCAGSMPRAWVDGTLERGMRVAILPLANYTERQDASDRIVPLLAVEMARQRGVHIVDPGRVEEVFAAEPWLLLDRLPPDLVEKFGASLQADALLVGSVLSFGYRDAETGAVPEISVTLRLLRIPGGKCVWSGTQARAGDDRESVFGLGRIDNLERLATTAVKELIETLPESNGSVSDPKTTQTAEQEK